MSQVSIPQNGTLDGIDAGAVAAGSASGCSRIFETRLVVWIDSVIRVRSW
jgi:hypothetical protein